MLVLLFHATTTTVKIRLKKKTSFVENPLFNNVFLLLIFPVPVLRLSFARVNCGFTQVHPWWDFLGNIFSSCYNIIINHFKT